MNFFYPLLVNQSINPIESTNNSTFTKKKTSYFTAWIKPFLVLSTFLLISIGIQAQAPALPKGSVTILPNGNYVVAVPTWSDGVNQNVGAVYLYDGTTDNIISTLTGSSGGDQIGGSGIVVLSNGNFVVQSSEWDNGTVRNAGAATWGSATAGVSGVVSASNSLVGTTESDRVHFVTAFDNGNYIVRSSSWDNGSVSDAGAVTWGNGTTGVSGEVSAANSLVGSSASDKIGDDGIIVLSNGNYLVHSPSWDNGSAMNAGAVTWCNGTAATIGEVSAANSLVGSSVEDRIGTSIFFGRRIIELSNGNYVVSSSGWDNGSVSDAGAVTWGDGTIGVSGEVSAANSLVGSSLDDAIGSSLTPLNNGNYVVASRNWDNGSIMNAGAVTWGDGTIGVSGEVSAANSLVGSSLEDRIGSSLTPLNNGNYVVASPLWDNGSISDAGAVTWCNGTAATAGAVSTTNSLVGSTASDQIGNNKLIDQSSDQLGVVALNNGNYAVVSPNWDNGSMTDVGAVTWGNGITGIVGAVSTTNSLVGSSMNDRIGIESPLLGSSRRSSVIALNNGNYVVKSASWDNATIADVGAVTWCDGTTGRVGAVSTTNSLVGSSESDAIGNGPLFVLDNSNYVVISPNWDNATTADVGAVTWCDGTTTTLGSVNATNSLIGSATNDITLNQAIRTFTQLNNGNYVIGFRLWDNGSITDAGAVTWFDGTNPTVGAISSNNSMVGSTANDQLGGINIFTLTNGNYVFYSPNWDDGSTVDVGAATWGNGTTGTVGVVSAANSLVGSKANDRVGNEFPVTSLSNGNYVVGSSDWNGEKGAVTWGNGTTGTVGVVSAANSLVGSKANDGVGDRRVLEGTNALSDGNYLVYSNRWSNGNLSFSGAVTFGDGTKGVTGVINSCNSVLGAIASSGDRIVFAYDANDQDVIISKPDEEVVESVY